MLFNSYHFLVFFPLVVVAYYAIHHKWRWLLLLVASYYFYMSWNPWYIGLIVGSTAVDYVAGMKMDALSSKRKKRPWLLLSLVANLGMLFTFKYFNFFIDNFNQLSGSHLRYAQFVLPVGISFYTFQTLSYSIDIYFGKIRAEKHLGRFALFVSFFPQLVAGPIERASHLLPQFSKKVTFNYFNFSEGSKRIIWGLFKKVVIADNLGVLVDSIYAAPSEFNSLALILGTYLFAFQIYCDFSGYSDIAIGTAKILGFDLMENFKVPYLSSSIREFWGRWHISLSTWFRDYVYIPLGGNQVKRSRWYFNIFIVFVVSGFWHGAAWTFIIWGALHGIYLVVENLINRRFPSKSLAVMRPLKIIFIFNIVAFGWIFFRAENVGDAWMIISRIADGNWATSPFLELIKAHGFPQTSIRLMVFLLFVGVDWRIHLLTLGQSNLSAWPKRLVYACLLTAIVLLGNWGEVAFLYFQF